MVRVDCAMNWCGNSIVLPGRERCGGELPRAAPWAIFIAPSGSGVSCEAGWSCWFLRERTPVAMPLLYTPKGL